MAKGRDAMNSTETASFFICGDRRAQILPFLRATSVDIGEMHTLHTCHGDINNALLDRFKYLLIFYVERHDQLHVAFALCFLSQVGVLCNTLETLSINPSGESNSRNRATY